MQVVSSLLSLQAARLPDERSRMMFHESRQRIKTMALIHEHLYQSEKLTSIDFKEYVSHLVHDLYDSYHQTASGIEFIFEMSDTQLELDTAIPCGLIVNELVSNAIKYAFPQRTGIVTLRLQHCPEGGYELLVQDDGIGMPEFFDLDRLDSLGLQLVKGLVEEQLGGIFELRQQSPGTLWSLRFPQDRRR
jgi:two-component sensor histidine kinase